MKLLRFGAFILFILFLISCQSGNEEDNGLVNDSEKETVDNNIIDDESVMSENEEILDNTGILDVDECSDEDVLEQVVFNVPDPAYNKNPDALIITKEEFLEIFKKYVAFHTVTGITTKVLTIEEICLNTLCDDKDSKNDTAKAIKNHVMKIEGLKYLILGGDIEVVPSRKIHDKYSHVLAGSFEDDFQSDFYYADFSDWDSNNNGIYVEDTDSIDYSAKIAVGRIPVSTVEEAEKYFEKIVAHNTQYDTTFVKTALLLANVATNFSGIDINAGYYFETEGRTRDIIPFDFYKNKLYTKTLLSPANDAKPLNNEAMKTALEGGVNLVVHNGHGYPTLLSCEQANNDNNFTAEMAYNLKNLIFPIFLSCACQAGQFEAPFTYTYVNSKGETVSKEFKDDSAGEKLINAPDGGSVFYLGNAITGLGLAGGSQFIDEMLKNMFVSPFSFMGDSYLYAHAALKKNDTFAPPIPGVPAMPVVDESSWKWTKKSVVALGSPLVIFWRDGLQPVNSTITLSSRKVQGGYSLIFNIPDELKEDDLKIFADDKLYTVHGSIADIEGVNIEGEFNKVFVGCRNLKNQPYFKEIFLQ